MFCVVKEELRKVQVHTHTVFTLDVSKSPGDTPAECNPGRQTGDVIVKRA